MNLNFLASIDITTIFGNLLDNAIEAAEKLEGEKYISIKIGSYHKMIAASIENNCGEVKWKNGFPVSAKGKGGGIGLLNYVPPAEPDISFHFFSDKKQFHL